MSNHERIETELFEVIAPAPDGWTLLYNEAAKRLIKENAAVIRAYLALCVFSNGDRKARPSLSTLSAAMHGVDKQTARRAVNRLEEIGLLRVDNREGGRAKTMTFRLAGPILKGINDEPKGYQPEEKRVSAALIPEQETEQARDKETSPIGPSDGPRDLPLTKELGHEFWTPNRRQVFDRFWTLYKEAVPIRAANRAGTMRAWRNTIAELTDDREWLEKNFGRGLDQNLRAWKEWPEEDHQFVPMTMTWIHEQRWNTPVQERR